MEEKSGIKSFGIGHSPDNNLGECLGELYTKLVENSEFDAKEGLHLNVKLDKSCNCDFDCKVDAKLDGEEIAIMGLSIEVNELVEHSQR